MINVFILVYCTIMIILLAFQDNFIITYSDGLRLFLVLKSNETRVAGIINQHLLVLVHPYTCFFSTTMFMYTSLYSYIW